MYFDYTIVLAFAMFGGLLALVANRAGVARGRARQVGVEAVRRSQIQCDVRQFGVGLVAFVLAAGVGLVFPWALILRDCLRDTGVAQSRGIGGLALLEGALFLVMLCSCLAYVWKRGDLDSTDPPAGRKP